MTILQSYPPAVTAWAELRRRVDAADLAGKARLLHAAAAASRRDDIVMIGHAGLGHIGGDLSVLDILTTLYAAVLRVDPTRPEWPERDRFILSKGHCAGALYVTLAHAGFFDPAELSTFTAALSPLSGHPNKVKTPGVETNTGPLGHGLPVAVGCAIGAALQGSDRRTFVVLGDGELQEGSNWEAAMAASQYQLGNLVATVDRNRLQQGARTEETNGLDPLADKWTAFGWRVVEVDGHDHAALLSAYTTPSDGRPTFVLANTVKGKGVSFMEDRVEWHHKVPNPAQVEQALTELSR